MSKRRHNPAMLLPPYRPCLEPARRIMRTQLVALSFLAAAAIVFFGYHALALITAAIVGAVLAEMLVTAIRKEQQPGTRTHSLMMALLLAFTLPAHARWYVAFIGAITAVLIGKQFFGGLGHYIWHPALVGRVIVQLFFNHQLSQPAGQLLSRQHIIFGNAADATELAHWLHFDWFTSPLATNALLAPMPLEALRHMKDLQFADQVPQLSQYLWQHLPSLQHFVLGAVPGGLGTTSAAVIILVGFFFIYRGYLNWQLPVVFLAAAYCSAMLLPIVLEPTVTPRQVVHLPIIAESFAVGLTYANYHLFVGGLLFAAFILAADMTSRPITLRGQIIFAAAAGLGAIVLRLYSPVPIPTYAALLAMNAAIPTIDRFTRPT